MRRCWPLFLLAVALLPVAAAASETLCVSSGTVSRPIVVSVSDPLSVIQVTARKRGGESLLTLQSPAPAAVVVASADTPGEPDGALHLAAEAKSPGSYSLRLKQLGQPGAGERCVDIEAVLVRALTPPDGARVAALAKLSAAASRDREGNREGREAAIRLYLEAAPLLSDDPESAAFAWHRAGQLQSETGNQAKAIELLEKSLASGRQGSAAVRTWYALGVAEARAGDRNRALSAHQKQLELAGDRDGQANAWNYIAYTYSALGEQQKALEAFQQVAAIRRTLGDRSAEANALSNVALAYAVMADGQKALDTYQQALNIRQAIGDKSGEAYTLSVLGNQFRDLGAEQTALEYYQRSIAVGRAAGDRSMEADTELGIGDVYFFLGEIQKSLDAYERAAALKRAAKDPMGEALALIGIANVYSDLANRQKPSESMGLPGKKKGLGYYEQSLALGRKAGDFSVQVFALIGAGIAYSATGEKNKAADYLNQGLFLFTMARYKPGEGWAKYELARVERDRGNLDKALTLVTNARDIIESVRSKVISPELRASFFAAVHDCFGLEVDILMSLHREAEALTASERARARVLLETLGESHAGIREGVDPALLERERTLQTQLNAKEMARMQLMGANQTAEAARRMEKEVRDLTAAYEEVNTAIRKSSPRFAAFKFPQPLTPAEIQSKVLDDETLLLEYSLGESRSFLWVASTSEVKSFLLPKRTELETLALRFRELVMDPAAASTGETGKKLSSALLGEAGPLLTGKRLLIVADGALQYLPFAALPDPASTAEPLIAGHEIVNLPSASTLAVLRRESQDRPRPTKTLAVLADPVFSVEDSRLSRLAGSGSKKEDAIPADLSRPLDRSLNDLGLKLPRLPGTRREAASIAALVPEPMRKQALDFEASRATLLDPGIEQYRILHVATHGLLNTTHAELSGVVLSMVDQKGKPQDGFLRLHEIYNLKLSADLVVLSACQTGLGKDIRGEGLVGLTRGFMYAGTPRVVASLWKVDDRATAELMKRFYAAMLGGGDAMRPAAALRAAQTAMARQKGFASPYYWAAFALQGEWR